MVQDHVKSKDKILLELDHARLGLFNNDYYTIFGFNIMNITATQKSKDELKIFREKCSELENNRIIFQVALIHLFNEIFLLKNRSTFPKYHY